MTAVAPRNRGAVASPENVKRVLEVLQLQRGAEEAITTARICEELDWPLTREREVRRIIKWNAHRAWADYGSLCAIAGRGFFFAQTIEEVADYRRYLATLKDSAGEKLAEFDAAAKKAGFNLKGIAA